MTAEPGRTPTQQELADARRSGHLAGAGGFPVGVCPYDPRDRGQKPLAQVWVESYTDARDGSIDQQGEGT